MVLSLAALAASAAAADISSQPVHAAPSAHCLISAGLKTQTCYSASQLATAESSAPYSTWTPISALAGAGRLSLHQIGVFAIRKHPASQIYFIFGSLPPVPSFAGLPGTRTNSRYAVIQEVRGVILPKRALLSHTGKYGSWEWTKALPGRGISLIVVTNTSRTVAQHLGARLVAAAAR